MQKNGEMHKILVKHLGETATKQYEEAIAKLDMQNKTNPAVRCTAGL